MQQLSNEKIRFNYLDGLRGIASFYVMLFHIYLIENQNNIAPTGEALLSSTLRFGYFGVAVFIVISGYCLMLPVVRSQDGYLPGGLGGYFRRRSRRILPTYYAALIFSLLVYVIVSILLPQITHVQWEELPHDELHFKFTKIDILKHFLLIHNIGRGGEPYTINGPLWSVALEWQIYFIFPLLFLPLWRRWGCWVMLAIAFIIGLMPHYLLRGSMDNTYPWLIGSFALGATAADIGFSQKAYLIKLKKHLPWQIIAIVFYILAIITNNLIKSSVWISESCISIAAASLIIYCTNYLIAGKELPKILNLLQSPIAIAMGKFSYSLYLTHAIVIVLLRHCLLSFNLPINIHVLLLYLIGIIASIGFAYLFYLLFEQPFTVRVKVK
jgi:peptidoglycan/LPS O-acetylase OafA/YrhL